MQLDAKVSRDTVAKYLNNNVELDLLYKQELCRKSYQINIKLTGMVGSKIICRKTTPSVAIAGSTWRPI